MCIVGFVMLGNLRVNNVHSMELSDYYTDVAEIRSGISIIIPTFNRHDGLKTALMSAFKQNIDNRYVEIIVVDNNKTPQEYAQVNDLAKISPFQITYVHVAASGLSNARNAGIECVKTRFVAFLDDDMIASSNWLSALIKTSTKFEAGIVFAPAIARMPNAADPRNPYMTPYFSRLVTDGKEGLIDKTLGMGGSLLDLTLCQLPTPVFDPQLNKKGGEDDILFDRLRQKGTKVAWSPDATTYEIVPINRATTRYIRARNFGHGQAPSRICADRGLSGVLGVLYFMGTGFIQAIIYAPISLSLSLIKNPAYIKYVALTSRAFGKIFWGDRFCLDLYGKTENS